MAWEPSIDAALFFLAYASSSAASQSCDVIVARAFASLTDFVTLTVRHLTPTGVWMAMKGKTPVDEMNSLPAQFEVFHVEQLQVPALAADRCLVWMRPRPGAH